jgi:hypothetical protein
MTERITEIAPRRRDMVVARLSSLSPDETDRNLLASLKRSCGLAVNVHTRLMFPENGPTYHAVTGVTVSGEASQSTAREALSSIEDAMEPATVEALTAALTRLSVVTAARQKAGIDVEMMAGAYLDDLQRYPADIALAVLKKPRQWWPTLHELTSEADQLAARRKAVLHKIRELSRDGVVGLIASASERLVMPGGRKLPDDWREKAGLRATAEARAKRWDEEPLTPNKTPVSASKSLAASLASPVVIGEAYREPGDLEAALRKMKAA